MGRSVINTDQAPSAIGPYSQAVKIDNTVFLSGQIPLQPDSMELVSDQFSDQCHQVFKNLSAVATAAGGSMKEMAKLTIYLSDLSHFPQVNDIMARYFEEPYPARAAVEVAALPKGSSIEIDAIMVVENP